MELKKLAYRVLLLVLLKEIQEIIIITY